MALLHRRDKGQPLRDAMRRAGLTGPELSARTREIDPTGKGVSPAVIGFLVSTGKSARDRCRLTTAWLIAEGVDEPLQDLFSMTSDSTSTVER